MIIQPGRGAVKYPPWIASLSRRLTERTHRAVIRKSTQRSQLTSQLKRYMNRKVNWKGMNLFCDEGVSKSKNDENTKKLQLITELIGCDGLGGFASLFASCCTIVGRLARLGDRLFFHLNRISGRLLINGF